MILPKGLEAHQGAAYMDARNNKEIRETIQTCPPVNPMLIAHLRYMFQDPTKKAAPTNPLLSQLLTIQYGVDKVLNYLEKWHENQSAAARKEHER